VKGQFVRAMNKVFHLNCFRCRVSSFTGSHKVPLVAVSSRVHLSQDCNIIVAAKFFPVEDTDESYPLCERDYFARLDLICGKCDKALRGSYITACCECCMMCLVAGSGC
jgi:hypothetical protein